MFVVMVITCFLLFPPGPVSAENPKLKEVIQSDGEAEHQEGTEEEGESRGPMDEFDRGTPRSSFKGFVAALRDSDYERGVQYLDLRNLPQETLRVGGPELVRQLKVVLGRGLWVDIDTLSTDPQGESDDGQPAYRDSLGRIAVDNRHVDLTLQRVPRGDGAYVWKVSNATVRMIPELYAIYGYGEIGEKLSAILPDVQFLGLMGWQWLMLFGLLGLAYLVVLVPTWLLGRLLLRGGDHFYQSLAHFLTGPLRLLVTVLLARSWIDYIHPGVTARAWLEGYTLVTILVTWVVLWLVEVMRQHLARRLEMRGRTEAQVLTRPVAHLVQLVIILVAVIFWLENLGFSATSLMAGLGIGGLAVALATQKPLENLIAAITLLSSQPVRVGDFCRFDDKLGIVEEIGLRATKIRTLEQTAIYVPNTEFAHGQIENFGERQRILYRPTIRLRLDTSTDQVRYLLVEIRALLYAHPRVEPDPARVRFQGIGDGSLEIGIYAYIATRDWSDYLEVCEDLNLRIIDMVEAAGTSIAYPSQTVSLERARKVDEEAARIAEEHVREWRERGELCVPRFPADRISELKGSLTYPPEGSATSKS